MGRFIVSENLSLDGVMQDPAGDEGFGGGGFGETSDLKAMHLVDARTIDGDTAYLTYGRARGARAG